MVKEIVLGPEDAPSDLSDDESVPDDDSDASSIASSAVEMEDAEPELPPPAEDHSVQQLGAHTDAVCSAGRRARDVAAEHEQVEVLEIFREHSVGADAPSDKDLVHLRLRPSARISCAAHGPTEAGRGGEPSARAGLVELSQVGVDGDYPGSARDS